MDIIPSDNDPKILLDPQLPKIIVFEDGNTYLKIKDRFVNLEAMEPTISSYFIDEDYLLGFLKRNLHPGTIAFIWFGKEMRPPYRRLKLKLLTEQAGYVSKVGEEVYISYKVDSSPTSECDYPVQDENGQVNFTAFLNYLNSQGRDIDDVHMYRLILVEMKQIGKKKSI